MTTPAAPTLAPITAVKTTILHMMVSGNNNNKYYIVISTANSLVCAYGRLNADTPVEVLEKVLAGFKVGALDIYDYTDATEYPQFKGATAKVIADHVEAEHNATVAKKIKKGYSEVVLATTAEVTQVAPNNAIVPAYNPRVTGLIDLLAREAQMKISTYTHTAIAALSLTQIQRARVIISQNAHLFATYTKELPNGEVVANTAAMTRDDLTTLQGAIDAYYSAVPTKMPRKIDVIKLIEDWLVLCATGTAETRLDQLEAQLANMTVNITHSGPYGGLNTQFTWLDPKSDAYKDIVANIRKSVKNAVIRDIFAVTIPEERARYDAETRGAWNIQNMFHCTRIENAFHILNTGYKIPTGQTHGWRLGAGIYNAVKAARAWIYSDEQKGRRKKGNPSIMFVNECKVGKEREYSGGHGKLEKMKQPEAGYDCSRGTHSYSDAGDEWVFYGSNKKAEYCSQITIRAIVLLD